MATKIYGRVTPERQKAMSGLDFVKGLASGALPQAGSGAAPCSRRHSSAAAPISATIRAKIPDKLM